MALPPGSLKDSADTGSGGTNVAAIVVPIVIGILLVAAVAAVGFVMWRRHRQTGMLPQSSVGMGLMNSSPRGGGGSSNQPPVTAAYADRDALPVSSDAVVLSVPPGSVAGCTALPTSSTPGNLGSSMGKSNTSVMHQEPDI